MKVLHVAAELFPFVKTGGLADVLGALPPAIAQQGADVRLVLPGFPQIVSNLQKSVVVTEIGAVFGAGKVTLRSGVLPGNPLPIYVIDAPYFYNRTATNGNPYLGLDGNEWNDNALRFALLSWVAAHIALGELDANWRPDVLHAHDWHAGLACAYVAAHPEPKVKTVFTIHNLAYQGCFHREEFFRLGLPARFMQPSGLEFHGQFSFLKAGLTYADRVTTVSPNYAKEIGTAEFGFGLEGVVRSRAGVVSGILNGVDTAVWNPSTDTSIAETFSAQSFSGKAQCKTALQSALGLTVTNDKPLFAIVSRLTSQKGLDLVLEALPELLTQGGQLAVLGSGDAVFEEAFLQAAANHRGQVGVRLGYDEAFAHQMIAGADLMLVPSRFEPCGLTQLYALRYGTVPLVRAVGGLADTVIHAETGFTFGPATSNALTAAIGEANRTFANPNVWRKLKSAGMARDFSWTDSAKQYLALYSL